MTKLADDAADRSHIAHCTHTHPSKGVCCACTWPVQCTKRTGRTMCIVCRMCKAVGTNAHHMSGLSSRSCDVKAEQPPSRHGEAATSARDHQSRSLLAVGS